MIRARGLGKGLSALIGENFAETINGESSSISLENIEPNPNQPRVLFSQNELEELSKSIKQSGVLQPILVRKLNDTKFQIIAGERRWRAAKLAGLKAIPTIVKELEEKEVLEIALVENIQRENLTPLEEAESYRRLIDECQYTQEKMAEVVSKSRSHITNLLRLLNLPDIIKNYLQEGSISLGHAKLLLNQENNVEIAKKIIENSLSVRETEKLIKNIKDPIKNDKKTAITKSINKDEDTNALETALSEVLEMQVAIEHTGRGGILSVKFKNIDQLDILVQKLSDSIS
jgi:ParB family transcriptional regulator, chromosome partitioning protein